jgi:UDP-glucose 6-dehydrogenase
MTQTHPPTALNPTIGVLGLGHVGLPTALGFAELGWWVVGADDDSAKAQTIAAGKVPFYEPGLAELLARHVAGRFTVAPEVADAVDAAEVLFVCVGTPQRDDGSADLKRIDDVARTIAGRLNGYKLIVEKSTTPVRTAERTKEIILRERTGRHEFDVAVNPEFLREGTALHDDDIREAPRLKVIERLRAAGAVLRLHDPQAIPPTLGVWPEEPGRLAYCGSPEEAARGAHALVIMTEWPEYRTLDLAGLRGVMALPILMDGRNALAPAHVRSLGFQYQGMGR